MGTEPIKILAINPGSRYVGLAVFYGSDLRDWMVRSLAGNSLEEKSVAYVSLLSGLIEKHGISVLVIKALHPARSSKTLRHLVQQAKKMCRAKHLSVSEFSINDLKRAITPNERSNKRRLMEEMATRYPFLYPKLERQSKSRNPYLVRMFEAVALGVAHLNDNGFEPEKVDRIHAT
jgi:Holliday junction resolvasome RuvABC endonuclease subunit